MECFLQCFECIDDVFDYLRDAALRFLPAAPCRAAIARSALGVMYELTLVIRFAAPAAAAPIRGRGA